MNVAVGCDHAGFPLKARVIEAVRAAGPSVTDAGVVSDAPSDYPDTAQSVARLILDGKCERGILLCGSGVGMAVAADKFPGIRACVCHDSYSARQGVEHDGLNVLSIGARVIGPELAVDIVRAFLAAEFTGEERHARRLRKVAEIERSAHLTVATPNVKKR